MPFQDLTGLGYTPKGAKSGGGFLEGVIQAVEASGKFVDTYLAEQEKKQKKEKDKIDAYVALRKAGYPEKAAYDAVDKWDYTKLKGVTGSGDLETEKTKAEIGKLTAETDKAKAMTERYKKGGGGYEDPDDIPKEEGSLPLQSIYQDKETGLFFGRYARKTGADKETAANLLGEEEAPGIEGVKKESWLSNMFGKFMKKPQDFTTEKTKAGLAKMGETKIIQGVTYKRGSDGKWHKQ